MYEPTELLFDFYMPIPKMAYEILQTKPLKLRGLYIMFDATVSYFRAYWLCGSLIISGSIYKGRLYDSEVLNKLSSGIHGKSYADPKTIAEFTKIFDCHYRTLSELFDMVSKIFYEDDHAVGQQDPIKEIMALLESWDSNLKRCIDPQIDKNLAYIIGTNMQGLSWDKQFDLLQIQLRFYFFTKNRQGCKTVLENYAELFKKAGPWCLNNTNQILRYHFHQYIFNLLERSYMEAQKHLDHINKYLKLFEESIKQPLMDTEIQDSFQKLLDSRKLSNPSSFFEGSYQEITAWLDKPTTRTHTISLSQSEVLEEPSTQFENPISFLERSYQELTAWFDKSTSKTQTISLSQSEVLEELPTTQFGK